jgi:hypothetical protein
VHHLKEPALSRVHRHRAPGTASRGAAGFAALRSAAQRHRARIILVLGMACAGLLIAAPVALFLAGGGSTSGTARDPEGVFTGDPNTGVGGGPGPSVPGVATESAQSPAPGLPPVDPAADVLGGGSGAAGGAATGGGVGTSGGTGTGSGAAPVAGAQPAPAGGGANPGGTPSGGGTDPGTSPGGNNPGGTNPGGSKPGGGEPAPDDCGCPENPLEPVTDVVDEVVDTVTEPVGGLLGK